MIFADTSFLVSYFGQDTNGRAAAKWWHSTNEDLIVSRLVLIETENSLRTLHLDGGCSWDDGLWAVERLARTVVGGLILVREPRIKQLYAEARRLSLWHSESKRYGAVDIIHVAAAKILGATHFVSFDQRQRELAIDEGLIVMP
jgi:predicted nucleic acid-binding protein